ncbi:MAG: hypothetical protein HY395_02040 [Candidatus Doudnabacteria bacterium]|nr:hypothetical protein [Candidatus Doudnabacteria bacterium]
MDFILSNKPVLVGLHLGFAILGIDLLLWLLGELIASSTAQKRMRAVSFGAFVAFILTWVAGGYYYVKYYGPLVKPIIQKSAAPWAHGVAMEAKEHIFLFLVPVAFTIFMLTYLNSKNNKNYKILVALTAGTALFLGLLGYIISAAARWA